MHTSRRFVHAAPMVVGGGTSTLATPARRRTKSRDAEHHLQTTLGQAQLRSFAETPSVTIAPRDGPHRLRETRVAARVFARCGVQDGPIVWHALY